MKCWRWPSRSLGAGAIYATHMRTEADEILDAMGEAFGIGRHSESPSSSRI